MPQLLKLTILFGLFFLNTTVAIGQQYTTYAEDAGGEITVTGADVIAKRIAAVPHIDRSKIASLKKCISKQISLFYANAMFHPPKGFVVKTVFFTKSDPFAGTIPFPPCMLSFGFYYLEHDKKTGGAKKSMDGTMVGIETNNVEHFFGQVGNYWKDCDKLHLPLFFEEPPVVDSTSDYIELDFRNYGAPHITSNKPFRVILRNNKPLFIPLTRMEFVHYLMAKGKSAIKDYQDNIKDDEKNIKEQEKLLSNPLFQSQGATIKKTIEQIQKNISAEKNTIQQLQQSAASHQEIASSMPSQEAGTPVRIDYSKNAFHNPHQALVPAGRKEGTALYKINPDYYDKSPGASGAQIIIVYYTLPRNFGPKQLNYLEQKTVDVFNHLDYHALKMSMR